MQLQAFMFILLMLIVIPLMMLSADHNVFFIVIAVILAVASFKNVLGIILNQNGDHTDFNHDDIMEEIEETVNIDIRKFGTGTKVAKNLIIILFLIYCSFYLNFIWTKFISAILILHWVHDALSRISAKFNSTIFGSNSKLKLCAQLFVNLGMLIIILLVSLNKYL